jgi:hypothetical protein
MMFADPSEIIETREFSGDLSTNPLLGVGFTLDS